MPNDHVNPWLFQRDELDLLEDELDEVFHLHEHSRDPVHHSMEEGVIDEQMRTEDAFERRLSDVLGPAALAPEEHACEHCKDGFPDGVALRDLLVRDRDPLYARAYAWATKVFVWSQESYWKFGMRNRDMFRAHVNAYLVPVKIAFALAEEHRDDEHAARVAGMEYELAEAYLERTRDSLRSLRAMGLVQDELPWMIDEANELAAQISERQSRLSNA